MFHVYFASSSTCKIIWLFTMLTCCYQNPFGNCQIRQSYSPFHTKAFSRILNLVCYLAIFLFLHYNLILLTETLTWCFLFINQDSEICIQVCKFLCLPDKVPKGLTVRCLKYPSYFNSTWIRLSFGPCFRNDHKRVHLTHRA